jgi:DNA-binding transcriptional ArsR family regulator
VAFGDTLKALSDPTRRKILDMLKEKSLAAGEISGQFDMAGATISHHLSILKQAGLITDRKQGKFIYYELNTSVLEELIAWISESFSLNSSEQTEHKAEDCETATSDTDQ